MIDPVASQFSMLAQHILDYNISLHQMQILLNYIVGNIGSGNITCSTPSVKAELDEMVRAELERVDMTLKEDKPIEKEVLGAGIHIVRLQRALDLTECIEREYTTHKENIR